MLTLKLINERTEWVIKGLEKKHFSGAKEAIENVLATDKKRREAQTQLDINLSESKKLAAQIGALMKQGKKEEAESIKTEVARLKDTNKALQEAMDRAQQELTTLLCAIPNIPYDIVPEGNGAEGNVVVKMGGMETELPKDALPHWELANKYKKFESFNEKFIIDDDMLATLREMGEKEGVKFNEEQYQKSLPLIKTQLKALIARDLWDMNEYFRVMNTTNESVQKALEILNSEEYQKKLRAN